MNKLFQNKFFLKSIQIFLVCLVVLGGSGNVKNVEAADNDILVYYTDNNPGDYPQKVFKSDIESLGFVVTIKRRQNTNELINGTINLSDYGQVWIIDCQGSYFTAGEITAIKNFRNDDCGGLLFSVDNTGVQERVNPVAKEFNNGIEIFYGTQKTASRCIIPSFMIHPINSGLNGFRLSSTATDACFNIKNSDIEVIMRNDDHGNTCGGSDIYGAVLDKAGKGRIVFDSSIRRFVYGDIINPSCFFLGFPLDGEVQYQKNIAQWLDVCPIIPLPTCTLTATPASILSGDSSTLIWTTTNADSVSVDNGVASTALNDSESVTPVATTTYTLTATNASGDTTTCSATVNVINIGGGVPDMGHSTDHGNYFKYDKDINLVFTEGAQFLLKIAGGLALFILIFGGVYYMVSGANPDGQTKAKKIVTYAVIGLAIVLISYIIVAVVESFAV